MYSPDRGIVKQLKESDPDLDVRFDSTQGRWIVTCLGKDVIVVQEPGGGYRPLDGRIVARMREEAWKYRKHFGCFHMLDRKMHEENNEILRKRNAARRDDFRQYVVEEGHKMVVGVGRPDGTGGMFKGWSATA